MDPLFYWPAIVTRAFWGGVVKIVAGAIGTLAITGVAGNLIGRYLPEQVFGIPTGGTWAWTWFGLFSGTVLYAARNKWHVEAGGDGADALEELGAIRFELNGETLDGKTVFGAYGGAFLDPTTLEGWIRTIAISAAPVEKTFQGQSVSAASIHTDHQVDALASIIRVDAAHGVLVRDPRDGALPILKARYRLTDPKGLQTHIAAAKRVKKQRPDLFLVLSSHERW